MDKMELTEKLDNRLIAVIQEFIREHQEQIEKVNTESYYERGTIRIKVIVKK